MTKLQLRGIRQHWADRREALDRGIPPPGQAEYVDLLHAVSEMTRTQKTKRAEQQLELLAQIGEFALRKASRER